MRLVSLQAPPCPPNVQHCQYPNPLAAMAVKRVDADEAVVYPDEKFYAEDFKRCRAPPNCKTGFSLFGPQAKTVANLISQLLMRMKASSTRTKSSMPKTSGSDVSPEAPHNIPLTTGCLNADAATAAVDADEAVVYPDEKFYAEDF
jgi:hypothetical protein